ncbi:MAG TPA: FAD-dependent oxidoreductase [Methylomirabilota bacterium]|nr:FAD-dependent oxidoreductase [Methylomirabilota bacterium]
MAKPVLLAVDDDREVLGAIERDLRRHFSGEYRVLTAASGTEALGALEQLRRRGSAVALFLVDQRMPGMTGIGFLTEARKLYPDAVRVLLTAYADTGAAIAAINEVGLNHYLMKPWDPPEERLYPVLDDLISDWSRRARPTFEGIRIVGSRWSPQSHAMREFLARNQVPYQWIDIDEDGSARELVASVAGDTAQLPIVLCPDGSHLIAPGTAQLAEKVGLQTKATRPFYDLVIVGGGPAGLANAVYGASEGLKVLLIEQHAPGGQAGSSSFIENYLGFPGGLTGADLAQRAAAQAQRFGTEMLVGQPVASLRREDPYRIVTLANGHEVSCHALVLAAGMAVRELDLPGVRPLIGTGIYYGAALSEAVHHRDQDVVVVGGANSAGQGALFFSRYARSVTMVVRAPSLSPKMSQYLVDRIGQTSNIRVLTGTTLTAACGERHLTQLMLCDAASGKQSALDASALFIFIGVAPHTESFAGFVEMDAKGFILTGPDLPRGKVAWPLERDPLMFETSVPGVFAAGDVRSGANRRIAAAVGEGSAAIYSVHRYLRTV